MAIKAIEQRVSELRKREIKSGRDSKTAKQLDSKEKLMIYLTPENARILKAYCFQSGLKYSHVFDELVAKHLKPEVKKSLLRS